MVTHIPSWARAGTHVRAMPAPDPAPEPARPRTPYFIVQEEITRGIDFRAAARAAGARWTRGGRHDLEARLQTIEDLTRAERRKPVVFASLPMARYIQRRHPQLAAGIVLPGGFLRHSIYQSLLPPERLLNPHGIYLPWGRVADATGMLADLFGPHLFLRPDSAFKPFAGFDIAVEALAQEHALKTRAEHIQPEELTFIAPAREIAAVEYRVWVIDGAAVTAAPYSWAREGPDGEPAASPAPVPVSVLEAAADTAWALRERESSFTADFAFPRRIAPRASDDSDPGDRPSPQLVELNALSTSGWYPGLDPAALFRASAELFV